MTGRLEPQRGGWYLWSSDDLEDAEVRVHLHRDASGRHRVDELRLRGSVSNEALRSIPIGRIEATADADHGAWPSPADMPADVVRRAKVTVAKLRPEEAGGSWSVPADALVVRRGKAGSSDEPSGRGLGDAFYQDIAALYQSLASETHKPAAALSEMRNVPVTTAHRWVREARRRGYLPPGRQGRAG